MLRRRFALLIGASLALFAGARAAGAAVAGRALWEDGEGNTHALRRIEVKLFESDAQIGTTMTDLNGDYSFDASPNPLLSELRFVAKNPGAFVSFDGMPANTYTAGVPLFAAPSGYTIANNHDQFRAFAVLDALYTPYYFASQLRPAAPAPLPAIFPTTEATSFFSPTNNNIHILSDDRWDWDVIGHEYAHYLAHLDNLDESPGGAHSIGASNIPTGGKLNGVRLAWGEGLATYLGVAAQHYDTTGQNAPTMLQDFGNTNYDDRIDANIHVSLESNTAPTNDGEGDEAAVFRILWDIGDNPSGDDDPIGVGLGTLYQTLRGVPNLDQLDDVWDHFYGISNDAERAEFGQVFEENGVSPHPFGLPISGMLDPSDPPPTFQWESRNSNRNDTFEIIFFNDDMTARLLDIDVPGDTTAYTLSEAEWDALRGMPQHYRFIVSGSDTTTFTTGGYWSSAYDFTVVPEPAVEMLVLMMIIVRDLKRRRARPSANPRRPVTP